MVRLESTVSDFTAGLGLAVVARIVEQLGGQLRAESKEGEGTRFSFLIPFELAPADSVSASPRPQNTIARSGSRGSSDSSEIESLVEALRSDHMKEPRSITQSASMPSYIRGPASRPKEGTYEVTDSRFPIKSVKIDAVDADKPVEQAQIKTVSTTPMPPRRDSEGAPRTPPRHKPEHSLRVLVVEVWTLCMPECVTLTLS